MLHIEGPIKKGYEKYILLSCQINLFLYTERLCHHSFVLKRSDTLQLRFPFTKLGS